MYRKIAPLCYLTILGFIVAVLLYSAADEKKSVDRFHIRQSLGLFLTAVLIIGLYRLSGSDLFYFDLPSIIILVPLFILWFLGFKAAMEDKEKPLPVVGRFYQKLFSFLI